jgi:hypothetical protein
MPHGSGKRQAAGNQEHDNPETNRTATLKDEMPDGDWRDLTVTMKGEIGHEVLRVKPSLVVPPPKA